MKSKKQILLYILAFIGICILATVILRNLIPLLRHVFRNVDDETKVIDYVATYGIGGMPMIAGLQFLQAFIPFLPATPIQVLAGLCYGSWLGALLCIIGLSLGHASLFIGMRKLGNKVAPYFENRKLLKRQTWLNKISTQNMKNPKLMTFFLYLIPAIPNGLLPIIFSRTQITFKDYLTSMLLSSIPSIFLWSSMGSNIAQGDYHIAIIIAIAIILLAGILWYNKNKILNTIPEE